MDQEQEYKRLLEYRELHSKARKKAQEKMMYTSYLNLYQAQLAADAVPDDQKWLKDIQDMDREVARLRKQKISHNYFFVTVSPRPDTGLDDLRKKVEKYAKRKMTAGIMYNYEWNKNGNVHSHMLVYQTSCSDSKFRENTKNTFKSLVDNLYCIDIRPLPDDWVKDKADYVAGLKWDPEKDDMIETDKEMRKGYGLEPFYKFGDMPLLDGPQIEVLE